MLIMSRVSLLTSHTIYMHTYMEISTNTKCYYSRTWSNANLTRGRIVEWQRRRSFYGAMSIAYKSLATRNEGSFSFVSSLKSLLTQVDSDYRRWSRGRFYMVTTQAIRVKLRNNTYIFSNGQTHTWWFLIRSMHYSHDII